MGTIKNFRNLEKDKRRPMKLYIKTLQFPYLSLTRNINISNESKKNYEFSIKN
jgi:hypothetical protein